ncbi:MAG: outer-membrane lipoprotein carrier protein LolA [Elusimicrobia bacterium]|nr:outer-membrane lipoprotein carrier protein LolA [Elusimicrobiota bacterium]MBU2615341.1 outer-membrane lipoprotein carrier protein LolA [Elusimicrobiota bacterium]
MKKLLVILFLFSAALSVVNAAWQKPVLDTITAKMAENEANLKSIQIEFSQEMDLKIVNEKNVFSGQLFFKSPDKIYYQTFTSTANDRAKQIIVSNGDKLWFYNIEGNQVFVDKWKNWKGIGYFLPGLYNPKGKITDLKKQYGFTLDSEDEKNYVLLLMPKKKLKTALEPQLGGNFRFYLWISKTDYFPVKSRFEAENITATTEITSYKINPEVSNYKFDFKIPAGAEVLRLFK